jgi:hypothetical protein
MMRRVAIWTAFVGMLLLTVGCDTRPSPSVLKESSTTPSKQPSDKASLASRFEAAAALQFQQEQQEAFAKLALDAAELGDAEITRKAIEKLIFQRRQQDVTYKSALKLAKAGKGEDAVRLAKSLISTTQREHALSKLAKGDYED